MRSSDALGMVAAACLATGCETTLPGGDLGAAPAGSGDAGADAAPPTLAGCAPFQAVAGITAVTGAVRTVALADGGVWAVVDQAVAGDASIPSVAMALRAGDGVEDCLASATLASPGAVSAVDPPSLTPLSGFVAGGSAMLYVADPSGDVGLAAQDPSDGRFRPEAGSLWTADRPAYGTAAATDATYVYAAACQAARFLDADCFVARAPLASPANESTYGYYVGGGRWSPRVDDAWPMTQGGSSMDIAWVPSLGRWLLAYVPPLGGTIVVRSGLSPAGPWSEAVPVASCALADPDMFCAGVHLHPALAAPAGTVALSYAPASLSPDVATRIAAEPVKWSPRLIALPVPPLP